MNATILYVDACKCMLSLEAGNQAVSDQLIHLLPKLRQALSCRVCRRLLIDPYGSHLCQHYVCKGCLRKKRSLNPGCRWCTNLEKLTEDRQTRILLACYQKLCECIAQKTAIIQRLVIAPQNGEYDKTLAIIQEAVTSPISLANCQKEQSNQVPANNTPARESNSSISSSGGNSNMASESRVNEVKLPPEVKILAPQKIARILAEPAASKNYKEKKRKRKPFKGTYYNYGKKKKTSLRLTVSAPNLSSNSQATERMEMNIETLDFGTKNSTQKISKEEEGEDSMDVDVVDNMEAGQKPEQQKQPVTVTPPGKNRLKKGKLKRCACGTSSKLQNTRCVSTRCPCFNDGGSCECCPCLNCGNPFNNNNDKLLSDDGCKLRNHQFLKSDPVH